MLPHCIPLGMLHYTLCTVQQCVLLLLYCTVLYIQYVQLSQCVINVFVCGLAQLLSPQAQMKTKEVFFVLLQPAKSIKIKDT